MAHVKKANNKRSKDGKPVPSYRVRWTEKARDEHGRPILFSPDRPDGRVKEVNRQRTFRSKEAAQEYCDEPNAPRHKVVAATTSELRKLGDQALGYFAQQYFEGLAGSVKPRYARETEAVYKRSIADTFTTRAVASITAADIRRFRADLLSPRPKRSYRPDEPVEMVALARTTIKPAYDVLRRILDVAVVDGRLRRIRSTQFRSVGPRPPSTRTPPSSRRGHLPPSRSALSPATSPACRATRSTHWP